MAEYTEVYRMASITDGYVEEGCPVDISQAAVRNYQRKDPKKIGWPGVIGKDPVIQEKIQVGVLVRLLDEKTFEPNSEAGIETDVKIYNARVLNADGEYRLIETDDPPSDTCIVIMRTQTSNAQEVNFYGRLIENDDRLDFEDYSLGELVAYCNEENFLISDFTIAVCPNNTMFCIEVWEIAKEVGELFIYEWRDGHMSARSIHTVNIKS